MARVRLRRNWFGPGGHFYEASQSGTEIPDSLLDQLPPDAKVMEDPPEPSPEQKEEQAQMTLNELQRQRDNAGRNRMIAVASGEPGPRPADLVETERLAAENRGQGNEQALAEGLEHNRATPDAVQGDTQDDDRPASSSSEPAPDLKFGFKKKK